MLFAAGSALTLFFLLQLDLPAALVVIAATYYLPRLADTQRPP